MFVGRGASCSYHPMSLEECLWAEECSAHTTLGMKEYLGALAKTYGSGREEICGDDVSELVIMWP